MSFSSPFQGGRNAIWIHEAACACMFCSKWLFCCVCEGAQMLFLLFTAVFSVLKSLPSLKLWKVICCHLPAANERKGSGGHIQIHLTVPLQMCLKTFLGWRGIFPFVLSLMFSPKFNSEREKPLLLHNWKSPNTLIVLPGKASNDIINLQTLFNTWRQLFHKQQITEMQTKWRDSWKMNIFPK